MVDVKELNIELLEKFADYLEHVAEEDGFFSMLDYFTSCGSPSCMAGHAIFLFQNEDWKAGREKDVTLNSFDAHGSAADLFGLDELQAHKLFIPSTDGPTVNPYDATAKGAAGVVRNLITTGEVDWTKMTEAWIWDDRMPDNRRKVSLENGLVVVDV